MKEDITVTCEENDFYGNEEFEFNLERALLITLFERKMITQFQFEYALECLERKFGRS